MSKPRSLPFILSSALPLLLACGVAQAFVATVGPNGSACDYTPASEPVQGDAIGQALQDGATEIRLVQGGWIEDVVVTASLALKGGYADCASASADQPEPFAISAMSPRDGRSLSVVGDGGNGVSVSIERIRLQDCSAQGRASGFEGGAIKLENGATVTATRLEAVGCAAEVGGAVHLSGGSSLLLDSGEIKSSSAVIGGGIYCDGANVYVGAEASVKSNTAIPNDFNDAAQGNGGGLYASNCTVDVLGRLADPPAFDSNTANRSGGGIYAAAGTDLNVDGGVICRRADALGLDCGDNAPVYIINNVADSDSNGTGQGGGIYAVGGSDIEADAVIFSGNEAHDGGAIAAQASRLRLGFAGYFSNEYDDCGFAPCVTLTGNKADNRGGALWLNQPTQLLLRLSDFRFNTADVGVAMSINDYQDGAGVSINNVAMAVNGDLSGNTANQGLVDLNAISPNTAAGDRFVISALTVDQNLISGAVLVTDDASQVNDVVLQSSLIQDPNPVLDASLVNAVTGDCLVASTALPDGLEGLSNTNVILEGTESGNYTPTAGTAALDVCTAAQMPDSASDTDLRNGERPIALRAFTTTPYDAGAVERPLLVQDIFADRFEANL